MHAARRPLLAAATVPVVRLAALAGWRVRATGTVRLQDGKWPAVTVLDSARLVRVPTPAGRAPLAAVTPGRARMRLAALLWAAAAAATASCGSEPTPPPEELPASRWRLVSINDTAVPCRFNCIGFTCSTLSGGELVFRSNRRVFDIREFAMSAFPVDTQLLGYTLTGTRLIVTRGPVPGKPARTDTGVVLSSSLTIVTPLVAADAGGYRRWLYVRVPQ